MWFGQEEKSTKTKYRVDLLWMVGGEQFGVGFCVCLCATNIITQIIMLVMDFGQNWRMCFVLMGSIGSKLRQKKMQSWVGLLLLLYYQNNDAFSNASLAR